jgi:glycosyltransferase involved in cell wall biosynthesis
MRSFFVENRMRICFVSLQFSPCVGGSQVRAEKQARQLQALGHEVTVLTLRLERGWKRAEILDGLSVVRVGGIYKHGGQLRIGRLGHFPVDIGMFLALWRLRHSHDVIHVFQVTPLAAVATLVGKLTQKPVIISVQNSGPSKLQKKQLEQGAVMMADTLTETSFLNLEFNDWVAETDDITALPQTALAGSAILNFLRKSKAYYQVLSNRGYDSLISHGFRAEQIVHISGSVDTEKFRPLLERMPDQMRSERDIICVARLEYGKGVDVLLHAWGRMLHAPAEWRAHLNLRLRLVGEGVLRPRMERIVAELGIADSVEFLGLRRDVVELLQQSWGFVLPSRWEGMPNALLEAMACGLPCVATRVSGSEDIISDNINGLLVEPEQPAEMAQALRRIIEDIGLAQRLGQEGRATVARHYQLSAIVEQCLQLYRCLLSRNKDGKGEAMSSQGQPLQHCISLTLEGRRNDE